MTITAEKSNKQASARKNGTFGFKALVKYNDGRTHVPVCKNFPSRGAAEAYAHRWIDANDSRPVGVRSPKVSVPS